MSFIRQCSCMALVLIEEPLLESGTNRLQEKSSGSVPGAYVKPAIVGIYSVEPGDLAPQDIVS